MSNSIPLNEKNISDKKNFWITFMGNSPLASLNCIWLAYERDNFLPDKIIFLATPTVQKQLNSYLPLFKELLMHFRGNENALDDCFEVDTIPETLSLDSLIQLFGEKINEYKNKGLIAVDVTPGRKIMSIAALEAAVKTKVDKIYYLHLLDEGYRNLFVSEIPCVLQTLYLIDRNGETKLLGCRKNVAP